MGWWLLNAQHVARYRHTPEWHHTDGFWFCMKCVKKGRPAGPHPRDQKFKMDWAV